MPAPPNGPAPAPPTAPDPLLARRLQVTPPVLARVYAPDSCIAATRLPPTLPQPFILRTSENLAPAVIAEILDLPLPRVQARLAAARQRLVRALALA